MRGKIKCDALHCAIALAGEPMFGDLPCRHDFLSHRYKAWLIERAASRGKAIFIDCDIADRHGWVEPNQLRIEACSAMRSGQMARFMRVAIQFEKIFPRRKHVFEESAVGGFVEISRDLREFRFCFRDCGLEPLPLAGGTVTPEIILPSTCGTHPVHVQRAANSMQSLNAVSKVRRSATRDALECGEFG